MTIGNKTILLFLFVSVITLAIDAQEKKNSRPVASENKISEKNIEECDLSKDNAVQLNVSVWNKDFEFLNDLRPENFEIYEGKKQHKISLFCKNNEPMSIGLLFDTPLLDYFFNPEAAFGAQESKDILPATISNIKPLLDVRESENEFLLAAIGKEPKLITGLTKDAQKLDLSLDSLKYDKDMDYRDREGSFDSIKFGFDNLSGGKYEKKILVLITDSYRQRSKTDFSELRDLVRQTNTLIYIIKLRNQINLRGRSSVPLNLERLTSDSGGVFFDVDSQTAINTALEFLVNELKNQYTIGFIPNSKEKKDKWHKVKVKVNLSKEQEKEIGKISVKATEGYYLN